MTNGRLDKPVYQLPLGMELLEIDEAVQGDERSTSEAALAALSVLRFKTTDLVGGQIEIAPRWMDLFKRLVEGGWKWRVAVYIAWAAAPKKHRWPETQEQLAIQCLGLNSDRAIATWRKKNPTIDDTISMLQASVIFDAIPDALNAMVEVATTSDYKGHADRKLMMEMAGLYTPSSKITAEIAKKFGKGSGDVNDLTDDELRQLTADARQTLEDRAKTGDQESAE